MSGFSISRGYFTPKLKKQTIRKLITVKPLLSGHSRGNGSWPLNRGWPLDRASCTSKEKNFTTGFKIGAHH